MVQVVNENKCKPYTRVPCLQQHSNSSGSPQKRTLKDISNERIEKEHETKLMLLEGDERRDRENTKDGSDLVKSESQEKDKPSSRRKSETRHPHNIKRQNDLTPRATLTLKVNQT